MRYRIFGIGIAISMTVLAAPSHAQRRDSPAACLKDARDFQAGRMKAAGGTLTADLYRQIQKDKVRRAGECAAQFSIDSVPTQELAVLAELYAEAEQMDKAEAAIDKALQAPGLEPAGQAQILLTAINVLMKLPASPERDARAEVYVARLDSLPDDTIHRKIEAHGRMNGYYRAVDIDSGILMHSTKLIEFGKRLKPEEQKPVASALTNAYINLAEALAGRGQTEEALDALRRAPRELKGIEKAEGQVRPVLERYLQIGNVASPIEARNWINAPPGTTRYDPKGKVTLLQFTAFWCGPCRRSYPWVLRLQKKFADRGLKVLMATQFYGYFLERKDLSTDEELKALTAYFGLHLGSSIPVAVADTPVAPEGKPGREMNPNDSRYHVNGIPQFHVIDRKGIHRRIIVGSDPGNEERLAALIEQLINESVKTPEVTREETADERR